MEARWSKKIAHLASRRDRKWYPLYRGEHLGGPFGMIEREPGVPAAGVAVVAEDAPECFRLGAELLVGQAGPGIGQHLKSRGGSRAGDCRLRGLRDGLRGFR
jgi:hypothetical protein